MCPVSLFSLGVWAVKASRLTLRDEMTNLPFGVLSDDDSLGYALRIDELSNGFGY